MSTGGVEELAVDYDARPAQARAHRWRRLFRSRLVSLGITVVVLIALAVWQQDRVSGNHTPFVVLYVVVLTIGVGWAAISYAAYRMARRVAAAVGEGVAVRINRAGVELAGQFAAWPDITELTTVKGRWPTGPRLCLRTGGAPVTVPLEQLDVRPATLDSTARAYSGGRHGVDLTALDT